MKFDVHVCLVSEQPTPNFVPVLVQEFRPKEVILVVTPSMKAKANALEKVMRERCQVKVQKIHIENEYDTSIIGERLFELLLNVDKEKVALNVTGGTKLMAIGAYSTFRDAGYPSFYVSEKTGEIQILDSNECLSLKNPKIRIEDYLELHGFSVLEGKRQINRDWLPVAEELIKHQSLSHQLSMLNAAISHAKTKQSNKADVLDVHLNNLDQNMNYFLSILEEHHLVKSNGQSVRFTSRAARDYMAGGWFEEYVFNLIQHLPNVQDCALGVQIDLADKQQRRRNELDVVFMANNALHVVECKTANFDNVDNDERNKPLYLLKTLKEIGGHRTKTAFISYRALGESCDHMKARADGLDIKVLEQRDLQSLRTLLKNWINPERKS